MVGKCLKTCILVQYLILSHQREIYILFNRIIFWPFRMRIVTNVLQFFLVLLIPQGTFLYYWKSLQTLLYFLLNVTKKITPSLQERYKHIFYQRNINFKVCFFIFMVNKMICELKLIEYYHPSNEINEIMIAGIVRRLWIENRE